MTLQFNHGPGECEHTLTMEKMGVGYHVELSHSLGWDRSLGVGESTWSLTKGSARRWARKRVRVCERPVLRETVAA